MKAVIKQPGKPAKIIDDTEKNLLANIEGYIEVVKIPYRNDIVIVLDEEGKLKNLKPNFYWINDIIVGPAIFLGEKGEDLIGLTDEQIKIVEDYLRTADAINPQIAYGTDEDKRLYADFKGHRFYYIEEPAEFLALCAIVNSKKDK